MRRLRKETREVFISYGAESKRELHDLIAALEAWIDRDRSEARARVEYLTGFAARWAATLERAPDQRLTTERTRSWSFTGSTQDIHRTPPHSVEAERGELGSMLISP